MYYASEVALPWMKPTNHCYTFMLSITIIPVWSSQVKGGILSQTFMALTDNVTDLRDEAVRLYELLFVFLAHTERDRILLWRL